jgi:hypothetical protein
VGLPTDEERAAAHGQERAELFALVEPPSRRERAVAVVRRLALLIGSTLLAMFGAPAAIALAGTFTVTNTSDNPSLGSGSLRAAITAANNAGTSNGTSTINVAATLSGDTINLASPLPAVQAPVVLNGGGITVADTLTPSSGNVLELDAAGPSAPGSDGSDINGLTLEGASAGAGLLVRSSNDSISADTFTRNLDGVALSGSSNDTLAGIAGRVGNVISGNTANGVVIQGGGSITLAGDLIGTDSSGMSALGNGGAGVLITGGSRNNTVGAASGPPNIISGNGGVGVLIDGTGPTATGNDTLQNNVIGTDANGLGGKLVSNAGGAVQFTNGTSGNLILGGVLASGGNDTFTVDLGRAPNHLQRTSLIGAGQLIIGGQNLGVRAGALSGNGYPITISGGPSGSTVGVGLLGATCTGRQARVQFLTAGAVRVGFNGTGTGTINAGSNPPSVPVFLADGINGTNNLANPCTGAARPPPPPPRPPRCLSLSTTPAPPFTPTGTNPNARFVQALFHDLLHRPVGPGLGFWTGLLSGGVTRGQVALDLEASLEYRADVLNSLYASLLGRGPSPSELNGGIGALSSGETDEQLEAALLGSPGYLASSGGTNLGFVRGLYCKLLGRMPSMPETGGWLAALGSGVTRTHVAETLLGSPEYRGDLANEWYLRFLRRPSTPTERAVVVGALAHASDDQAIAGIVGSSAYFHVFTHPGIASLTISRQGVIRLRLTHPATIDLVVIRVVHGGTSLLPAVQHLVATDSAAKSFRPPQLRHVGVVSFGRHHRGLVVIHWNRRLHGHRLRSGHYLLVLQVRRGGRIVDVSDAIPVTIH